MSQNQKDKLSWWGKSEQKEQKGVSWIKRDINKKESSKKTPKKFLTRRQILIKLLINCVVIGVMILLSAVVAHFILQSVTRHGAHCDVPRFERLSLAEAERVAAAGEFRLIVTDSLYAPTLSPGMILDQLPKAGVVVKPGRAIYVTINATQQKQVEIPYVAGRSLRQAKNMLEVAGFTIERLNYVDDIATNYILAQSYNGKEITSNSAKMATIGSGITLTVGVNERGNHTIIPSVLGESLTFAKSKLWGAGLNVGEINLDGDVSISNMKQAMVYAQDIEADSDANMGDEVSLWLTLDTRKVSNSILIVEEIRQLDDNMRLFEEAMADSLAMQNIDTTVVEIVKPKVEKVEFEDLFN